MIQQFGDFGKSFKTECMKPHAWSSPIAPVGRPTGPEWFQTTYLHGRLLEPILLCLSKPTRVKQKLIEAHEYPRATWHCQPCCSTRYKSPCLSKRTKYTARWCCCSQIAQHLDTSKLPMQIGTSTPYWSARPSSCDRLPPGWDAYRNLGANRDQKLHLWQKKRMCYKTRDIHCHGTQLVIFAASVEHTNTCQESWFLPDLKQTSVFKETARIEVLFGCPPKISRKCKASSSRGTPKPLPPLQEQGNKLYIHSKVLSVTLIAHAVAYTCKQVRPRYWPKGTR